MKSAMTTDQAVVTYRLSKPPLTGVENYQYLQQFWGQQQMSSFKDFLRWYNKKCCSYFRGNAENDSFLRRQ